MFPAALGIRMPLLAVAAYAIFCVAQFLATLSALSLNLGVPWFAAIPLSAVVAVIPFVGSLSGAAAAMYAWHWGWPAAILFCVSALVVTAAGFKATANAILERDI